MRRAILIGGVICVAASLTWNLCSPAPEPDKPSAVASGTAAVPQAEFDAWSRRLRQPAAATFRRRADTPSSAPTDVPGLGDSAKTLRTFGPLNTVTKNALDDRLAAMQVDLTRQLHDLATVALPEVERLLQEALVLAELAKLEARQRQLQDGDYWTMAGGTALQWAKLVPAGYQFVVDPVVDGDVVFDVVFPMRIDAMPEVARALAYLEEMRAVRARAAADEFNRQPAAERSRLARLYERTLAQQTMTAAERAEVVRQFPVGVVLTPGDHLVAAGH